MENNNTLLLLISLVGCQACAAIEDYIVDLMPDTYTNFDYKVLKIATPQHLANLKLNIKVFPTLLAYKNNKPHLGWGGCSTCT